jgi:hypothetical protein
MLSETANSDSSVGSVKSTEQAQLSGLKPQNSQMYDILFIIKLLLSLFKECKKNKLLGGNDLILIFYNL